MMPRILLLMLLSAVSYSLTFAAATDCGLGTTITRGDKSIASQTVAYTTNDTFHITTVASQTSGCDYSGIVQKEQLQEYYLAQTFVNLEEEAAKGKGPYLTGLAELMECTPQAYPAFGKLLQADFAQLFEEDLQNHEARSLLLTKIRQRIKVNSELSALCKIS